MSDVLSVREDLADHLRDMIGDTLNVYHYPAESIALPAAVIVPASPWWEPGTMGTQPSIAAEVRVNLDIQLIVPRTEVETAFDLLESYGVAVGVALASFAGIRWVSMGAPDAYTVGEIPALGAVIQATGKY